MDNTSNAWEPKGRPGYPPCWIWNQELSLTLCAVLLSTAEPAGATIQLALTH